MYIYLVGKDPEFVRYGASCALPAWSPAGTSEGVAASAPAAVSFVSRWRQLCYV